MFLSAASVADFEAGKWCFDAHSGGEIQGRLKARP
jgi:hypothetical protein